MRRLIVILLFLIASVFIGIEVMKHPGYMLIVYQPWTIQMPVWFATLVLIVMFALFYLLITSIDRVQFFWFRIKNWLRIRREHRSYNKSQHGLAWLIEGRWDKAERLLLAGVSKSLDPLINYLGAAKAAQEQGAYDRRDEYIKKAYQIAPGAKMAIGLVQAELEFAHNQVEQAAATLNHLYQENSRHPRVLKLLEKVYVRLGDWQQLLKLLPNLRKSKVLNAEQAVQFEKHIYCEMLRQSNKTLEDLQAVWTSMPRYMRKNPDVVAEYVMLRLRFNATEEVEELIRKTLKHAWQPELVRVYGTLPLDNLNRQLVIAGAWLKMYGQKPEILLTLGRLCVRVQLWGKAKDYFRKCLSMGPNPEALREYEKLLEELGEEQPLNSFG